MPGRSLADNIFHEPAWLALVIFAVAGVTILGALGIQHIGGYQPCALCLMQRTPYYLGIPVAAAAGIAALAGAPRAVTALLFALIAVLMLYNAGLGAYHAGVEWKFWAGPASCAPSVEISDAADMLNKLRNARAPSCTEATWQTWGVSLAAWNALISASLAALAAAGAALCLRTRPSRSGAVLS